MPLARRRALLADVLGLGFVLLALADYLRPSLLLAPTIAAGGDTPCHYPTAVYFHEHLLPQLRFHGWYAGAYLGHPLLLYYFPLPFLLMSVVAPALGLPVAFKLGTAGGVFLLPLLVYASFRLMGFRFPGPLLGAASALFFLFLEDNPIWGGTLASTLTGEFSYTYGLGLAVLFLGFVYRDYGRGKRPWAAALVLAVTALAHGYAVLWAGLSSLYFLYGARRPGRTIVWLGSVAIMSFCLVGFWLLPLLADWGWTTPYNDPWIEVTGASLLPRYLWPAVGVAALGVAWNLLVARRSGGPDQRVLFLLHAGLVGAALAAAGPALGIIDVRFVPFAQFALCLVAAASLGLLLASATAPDLAALGIIVLVAVYGDSRSQVLRYWIEWNYTGLEAKELWPAFRELSDSLEGGVGDPRIAVEYSSEHERAGSIRMYETLPFFTGRPTVEGVYNQASLQTHPVYYLASELGAASPNPFKSREYSRFDTDNAIRHLRLFNVSDIVALSKQLITALEARQDVELRARIPPYVVFRLKDHGPGYVEPLAYAPVRSSRAGWRDKAYRWFTRKPLSPVQLVFTDAPQFAVQERDEWLEPPAVPLPLDVEVRETMDLESLTIHTSKPGHPLLVKISYHPRWRAEGADGPYLVSPALMMIIPRQATVRLFYSRTLVDALGTVLSLAGVCVLLVAALIRRRHRAAALVLPERRALDPCALPPSPRRWGVAIPAGLLMLLVTSRMLVGPRDVSEQARDLYTRASQAYAKEDYADAAEYARHATSAMPRGLRGELLCLQGESLLRAGRPAAAAEAFEAVPQEAEASPYLAQALFGSARAKEALGDADGAVAARTRLLREFPDTPWAGRLREQSLPRHE